MKRLLPEHRKKLIGLFCLLMISALCIPSGAAASELLQNPSFENYDAATLAPDNWRITGGNVQIYADQAQDGAVSVYSLGGTMIDGTDTPNPPQRGAMEQVVDMSATPGWGSANWLKVRYIAQYRRWGGGSGVIYLDFLPPGYNGLTVAADDPAWSGPDVETVVERWPGTHASASRPWNSVGASNLEIPRVRWARARLVFNAQYRDHANFEDGPYYFAFDNVSLTAEAIVPETPCSDNLLLNPGFETTSGDAPTDWEVISGRMTTMAAAVKTPYAGNEYVGNIGGYATPNPDPEATAAIDHPDPPQNGAVAQLIDLSTRPDWDEATYILYGFNFYYLTRNINGLSASVEYLPESYNETPMTCTDAAWSGADKVTALKLKSMDSYDTWRKFETGQGSLPKVRWVRVSLIVENGTRKYDTKIGQYLGGFDQVCFTAQPVVGEALILNPGFENMDAAELPLDWYQDPAQGAPMLLFEPIPPHGGSRWLGKAGNGADMTTRLYQVIDLADKIPGWVAINPQSGSTTELPFIQFALEAAVTNIGGTRVAVGLEYLPYSYNTVDGIAWDNAAWRSRQWTSDGTTFANSGGDAIDLGALIDDTTVSLDPPWRAAAFNGWIPRVRWIRLRIELDATATAGAMNLLGIDDLKFSAMCKAYGPYSGFGRLPEANFPGPANAIDQGVPAWVGPEGDGISGGYTGKTKRNYINPAFAGFADGVADYSPSGQHIYNNFDKCPECITGRPWNDASWNKVIITMGDLDHGMLADYFGPAPTGDYHPGEITATFNESPIVNGPGPDFATFENGFVEGWVTDRIFGELAYVEVSTNGADFIRFPTHCLTPHWPGPYGTFVASGIFGMTGKHVNAYGDQWGTPFDLDWIADHPLVLNGTVDLNNIRYVRQVDIPGGGPSDANSQYTGLFYDSYGNPVFDSWVTWGSGGADLDAIAVLNTSAGDTDGDAIVDYWDNCSETANEKQYDTDQDGYGNHCDCDIDGDTGGDGTVNLADYAVFRMAYGGTGPERIPGEPGQPDTYTDPSENWNADADFNGDNTVDLADYAIFRSRWNDTAPFN